MAKVKKELRIAFIVFIILFIAAFIMKNFFPAEWSFITPHKQGDFVRVGNMNISLYQHTGEPILLNDGRVLLIGQEHGKQGIKKCEYYNPKTRRFHLFDTIDLKMPDGFKAVKLLNGRVMFMGGSRLNKTNYSIFFDPKINNFTKGPGLITGRRHHSAILLSDGRVFIAGGELDDWERQKIKQDKYFRLETTEFYNPKTNKFEQGPNLPEKLAGLHTFLNKDGNVIIIGGYGNEFKPNLNIYLFNPVIDSISKIGELKIKRGVQKIVMLNSGKILLMQGNYSKHEGIANEIEIFDPDARSTEIINIFEQKKRKSVHPVYLCIAKCSDDMMIFYGGSYSVPFLTQTFFDIDIYNAKNNKFIKTRKKTRHSYYNCFNSNIVLKDGNLLLLGGGKNRIGTEIYKTNKKIKR